jgi:hypothetical protein
VLVSYRVSGHGQVGREAEARSVTAQLVATTDGADKTIAEVARCFQRRADRDLYATGLRKAGLPEA